MLRSLRAGKTPAECLLLDESAANSTPPGPNDRGWPIGDNERVHVYIETTGTVTACTITPYYWSAVAQQWFAETPISFGANARFAQLNSGGEDIVIFRLTAVTGVGRVRLWAAVRR